MAELFRADHVGSLLRPPELLEARTALAEGRLTQEQLRVAEDRAVMGALTLQREVGIDVFTDGEFRRSGWSGDFMASVDGYVASERPVRMDWHGPTGETTEAGGGAARVIGSKLRQKQRLTGLETTFLKQHASGPMKVTLPAASYVAARGYKRGVSDHVYPTRADALRDIVAIIRAEIEALIDGGVAYIQLDNPHYPDYVDAGMTERWRALGVDLAQTLSEDIEADNQCLQGLNRGGVTVAMHLCRGNSRSGWHTQGGYDAVAEQVFGGIDVDRWLLEYDSERAGGLEPLRLMPKGKQVVLGLVSSCGGSRKRRATSRWTIWR